MPEVNRATPASPASSPSRSAATSRMVIIFCRREIWLLRGASLAVGPLTRLATWRRSRSMVIFSFSTAGRRLLPDIPAAVAERSCASSENALLVVPPATRSWPLSPSAIAASRSDFRSAPIRVSALL